ncbi:response regulator [Caryophanon latum]|uniref:Two-component system response regulator n=1 Tax=Caryophanon latum TaxID=33977 RepID=A0A1C0YTB6_9BACL|nr:response regulator [Caryophanon latum]OCS90400.1 two-component system response regulator [Caryophanon latum]
MATVLVVDDAMFMRVTISNMMEQWGYRVVAQAANGQEAIAKFEECEPDVVTMDVTMPIMNGIDAVKTIMERNPDAKIVMITALGQQKLIKQALAYGAKDFVTKPFDPVHLKEVIDNVLTL